MAPLKVKEAHNRLFKPIEGIPNFPLITQQACEHLNGITSQHVHSLQSLQQRAEAWVKQKGGELLEQNEILQQVWKSVEDFKLIRNVGSQSGLSQSESFSFGRRNFAAIIPGDSVAEMVVTSSVFNFLNIYNTLLISRLVLTWFPSAPQVIVNPLSTICDPYLNVFRGVIPPLGQLDLSPILAFLVLNVFTNTASALPAEMNSKPREKLTWRQVVQQRKGQKPQGN